MFGLALMSATLASAASLNTYRYQVSSVGLRAGSAAPTIPPGLSNFSVPAKGLGDAPFALIGPTTGSSGAITYSSSNPAVASVSGSTVNILALGTTTITASQGAMPGYPAATISAPLTVALAYISQGGLTWMPVVYHNYSLAEAVSLCAGTINGQTGWRLPTITELYALAASGATTNKGWNDNRVWSSTEYTSVSQQVLQVSNSSMTSYSKANASTVATCVK